MQSRQLVDRVERARKLGARGVELLYESSAGVEIDVVRGRAGEERPTGSESLTVRVWLDGGRGAERAGPAADFDALVERALADAASAAPDPHGGPIGRQQAVSGGLGIDDRRFEAVEAEDREEVLVEAERSVKAVDRRLTASGFRYRDQRTVRRFASSRGVNLEEWSTLYEAEGTVVGAVGGEEVALSGRIASRTFASAASLPFGTLLARRVMDLLQPAVPLQGEVRVLLPPLSTGRLFGRLADHFDARTFEPGGGFFLQPRADGAPVVDPRLHLIDDGTLPGGLRTSSFDDRGVPPVPLTLLREGRVDGRFVDPERAHALDARPTGHVRGGVQRPSNLALRSGTRSMSATLSDLGGVVLVVDDLPDLSGLDPATGRLRVRVDGVVRRGHEVLGAVRGRWLEGDLSVALNRVVEVCSDTDRHGHVDAPGLVLDGLSLAD